VCKRSKNKSERLARKLSRALPGVGTVSERFAIALIPVLTVTVPIKKWSAAAALAAAAFYLLLSGAEVATQRSFFMTAVVLIAIMVDRDYRRMAPLRRDRTYH
jgi:predicted membrane metal-binding protein